MAKRKKNKILVIDDDVQFVETVRTLLEGVGYAVHHAYHGKKGLELAREIVPNLILLDVMFAGPPGPDGFQLSREIRQDPKLKDIPVIIISGVRKVLDLPFTFAPDGKRLPVAAFLEKPVKPDELLAEIEKALGKRG